MRDCRLLIGLVIGTAILFASNARAQERIKFTAKLTESADDLAKVIVSFKIDDGWHAYSATEVGQVLEVKLALPDDVVAAGRWQKPKPVDYGDGVMVYKGDGSFSRVLSVPASDAERQVVVTVLYQACNDDGCLPPDEIQFKLPISEAILAPTAPEKNNYTFDNTHLSTPELLMAEGELLNTTADQHYVSPGMHDIDNDGDLELVTGGVAGKVRVYENENKDQNGQPVWIDAGFLHTTSGEDVMGMNW